MLITWTRSWPASACVPQAPWNVVDSLDWTMAPCDVQGYLFYFCLTWVASTNTTTQIAWLQSEHLLTYCNTTIGFCQLAHMDLPGDKITRNFSARKQWIERPSQNVWGVTFWKLTSCEVWLDSGVLKKNPLARRLPGPNWFAKRQRFCCWLWACAWRACCAWTLFPGEFWKKISANENKAWRLETVCLFFGGTSIQLPYLGVAFEALGLRATSYSRHVSHPPTSCRTIQAVQVLLHPMTWYSE